MVGGPYDLEEFDLALVNYDLEYPEKTFDRKKVSFGTSSQGTGLVRTLRRLSLALKLVYKFSMKGRYHYLMTTTFPVLVWRK